MAPVDENADMIPFGLCEAEILRINPKPGGSEATFGDSQVSG